jgi:hypothetical protein
MKHRPTIRASALGLQARALFAALLCAGGIAVAHAQDAVAMRARYEGLRAKLDNNAFHRPLYVESTESGETMRGDVYVVVEHPFGLVEPALTGMDHWCTLLILHLNVKLCSSTGKPPGEVLSLVVGRKVDEPIGDGYKVDFGYSMPAATSDYLRVQMAADSGPLSTRDYRLTLEAAPLDSKRSFVHMSFSQSYGAAARLAMQLYLATIGRAKIGFSIIDTGSDGQPIYIDGVRGVVERNTMRYYLAIEAYLDALSAPPDEQLDKRLSGWFAATEKFPAQLHEIERDAYLTMKHHEIQRQQATDASAKR